MSGFVSIFGWSGLWRKNPVREPPRRGYSQVQRKVPGESRVLRLGTAAGRKKEGKAKRPGKALPVCNLTLFFCTLYIYDQCVIG